MFRRALPLLLCVIFLAGCSKSYLAERAFWRAQQQMKSVTKAEIAAKGVGVLDPVIASFQKVIDKYPGTPKAADSHFVITNLYLRQQNVDKARETLRKFIRDFSNLPQRVVEAREGLAKLYEAEGNWDEAEKVYWELAEYHALNAKGLYAPVHIIIHYKKLNDVEGQKKAYQRAINYYEKNLKTTGPIQPAAGILNYEGLAELANGNWEQARSIWLSISEKFPDSPYAPLALLAASELSWKKQETDKALEGYNKFFELYPNHGLAHKTMVQVGMLHAERQEYDAARDWYSKFLATKQDPNSQAQVKLLIGQSYQAEGNWDKAEEIYQDIEKNYPDSGAALQVPLVKFNYFESIGQDDKAKAILDEAIRQYEVLEASAKTPEVASMAQKLQFKALAEGGDWDKLIENFDERMGQAPTEQKRGSWLLLKALVAENRLKDTEMAKSLYEQFLSQYPDHPMANYAKSREEVLLKASNQVA